ncbi:MAG: amidohydrolase family protein [Flavobacteriales bacterium]|nr:amidohydrolase family protein [Flavobacteriales bacterium]
MRHTLLLLSAVLWTTISLAQETHPVNGVHDVRMVYNAFTNARVHITPEQTMDSATLLIQDGRIVACGKAVEIPAGTVVHDCAEQTIYPSFIDAYAGFNFKKPTRGDKKTPSVVNTASNWNPAIHPEFQYAPTFPIDKKVKEDWLAGGIGVVNVHERDGIMRGTGALFHIGIDQANQSLILPQSSAHYSFSKGNSTFDYPSSHIGAIALFRQTMLDAQWYASSAPRKEVNASLRALNQANQAPNIFELGNELSYRNVGDLAAEFDKTFILKGNGKEYLIRDHLRAPQKIIVPTSFPKPFDIQDPLDARMVSLEQLKHWEAAPFNPYFLATAGHTIALTRDTIRTHKAFLAGLKKITQSGLSHGQVLAALTTSPADFLHVQDQTGTLEPGKLANFFLSNGDFTDDGFKVLEHWNKGVKVYDKPEINTALIGSYNLVVQEDDYLLDIKTIGEKGVKATVKGKESDVPIEARVEISNDLITLVMMAGEENPSILYQLSGKFSLGGTIADGKGTNNQGQWVSWAAVKDRKSKPLSKDSEASTSDSVLSIPILSHPNRAFGWDSLSTENSFVITNAVVWTCADTGTLEQADIWVEDGKIKLVGSGVLYPSSLKRIDAKGRHVTPGMIDEHSHIALRGGVNESAQASSAEVRIKDAIDPSSIHIYRQLGGGVTAAQLLHGSANPIGGQSALIKLKWGASVEEMLIDDAVGFIKFALGENVKRSSSPDPKGRFPLTRMGVEQMYVDAFTRAQEYASTAPASSLIETKSRTKATILPPTKRRDLQLEALVEILNKERFITCHSYVQSEILMLMQVADSFGFNVNTFTHILEGYKVAPQMVEHGVGGSTFSDWWAYKYEVSDAIPYNASIMAQVGVITAINSDDAEMGRRLNQEAAKSIKYGGMSEEQALNMVTINPARLLHLDHRMGSIEAGKDADLVVWNGHPLSVYAHPDQTYIEGIKYFDANDQERLKMAIAAERTRIIEKMLQAKGQKKQAIQAKEDKQYHCDTIIENYDQE